MNDDRPNQITGAPATLEKIRPELNLEKWSVWQPAKSKNPPKARTFERQVLLPDGSKSVARVKIGFTDEGVLTTEDQKTYYALVREWEEQNGDSKPISFSLQRLAKNLNKKWGTNVITSLVQSLRRLRITPFTWENSYFDNSTKKTVEVLEIFNIISELKIITKKTDGTVNKALGYFRFNDFILKNLQTNHTKPIFFDVVINFKSEIAQLLYTHLDLVLNDKTAYERCTKELFDNLGIIGTAYNQRSKRKQMLVPALVELHNAPLSSGGIITSATIEETKDKKDYKIVIRRNRTSPVKAVSSFGERRAHPADPHEGRGVADDPDLVPAPTVHPAPEYPEADELLRHFNTVFFKTESSTHTSTTHRDHAISLIARHGLDVCRYIVDFAHREAERTHFPIATFGGILQYIDRAVSDYDRRRKQQREEAERAERTARYHRLEADYEAYQTIQLKQYVQASYTPDQYKELIEIKKQSVRALPMAARWSDDAIIETAKAGVHRDLFAQIPNLLSFEEFCRQEETPTAPAPVLTPLLLQPASITGEIEAKTITTTPPPPFEA